MRVVIWWIRRDLRLHDNPSLRLALESGLPVQPIFILDPAIIKERSVPVQSFLWQGLSGLDQSLKKRGSNLTLFEGKPVSVFSEFSRKFEIERIYAEEDYSPYAQKRDTLVSTRFPLQLITGLTAHHPSLVTKEDGSPYTVFTPFSKKWKQLFRPCSSIWDPPDSINTLTFPKDVPIPKFYTNSEFPAGEKEALKRLSTFLHVPIYRYENDRNRMDLSGTSGLSPYFHSGMLSICRAINLLNLAFENANEQQAKQSVGVWLNELIWREFYHSILYNFPNVRSETFNPKFRSIEWRNSSADLHAWQKGETGFPIVDAGMRQLLEMGWMHNRARMIVASFLSKDLLINWQEGEAWFLKHLIDADIAANNGGWQWIAGVGTDAAPYFRIFNPTLQSMKFDPQGDYIRKWVPELRNVPATFIHEPIKMRSSEQKQYKCRIGIDYPKPIVDRKVSRLRTLEAYKRAKEI